MATVIDFRTRFPEFLCTEFSDDRIQMFLNDALMDINVDKFGDLSDRAQLYLSAHYLAIATATAQGNAGNVGKVQSKAVDGVSVTYGGASESSQPDIYESTSYGQQYLEIVKRVCPGMCTYGVDSNRIGLPALSGVPV